MSEGILLSEKYKTFLRTNAAVEFLEGTTFAGKTTVGVIKFMFKVAASPKKLHILSGLDTGTIEKNIINKDLGIVDIFGDLVEYNPSGKAEHSMPHIAYTTNSGKKIIYILGYDNKARWKKALGGQYGCLYIDEINIADMEYVREAAMRCDYLMATLNPDSPSLPIYSEYINHARPLPEFDGDAPRELRSMLNEEVKDGWIWWYFSFDHNAALTPEKKAKIIANVPPGTKLYKNKILGLRGRATGLVFFNFEHKKHLISREELKRRIEKGELKFVAFTAGLDTAYSTKSPDTIAMTFMGVTDNRQVIYLDEKVYNNANIETPIAPSDTAVNFVDFLDRNGREWGVARNVFIDCADQATITELKKYKRKRPCVYIFNDSYKKVTVIDRINFMLGWLHSGHYLICEDCKEHIKELESYSWKEDKDNEPEDANDHTINASQYAWIPYRKQIGTEGQ